MNLIAAVDNNWGIGKDGNLLISIPDDMEFFRTMTSGKVVVMGRKTLESFPGGKPLKNRTNLVLTKDSSYSVPNTACFTSVKELLKETEKYPEDEVFVIGGAHIYKLLLPYCKKAYITHINAEFESDTFFPNLSNLHSWEILEETDWNVWDEIPYKFCIYLNNSIKNSA